MQPNNCINIIVFLMVKLCAGKIVLESSESYKTSEVDKAAIDVITSCYGNRGNAVAVGGIISNNIVKGLLLKQIPIVLVTNSTRTIIKDSRFRQIPRYRLQVFVLAHSTSKGLRKSIIEIQKSVWWNHMAFFLILYRSSRGCKDAELFLSVAWYRRIINAKILCFDSLFRILILGYNPYTTEAPEPWRLKVAYPYATLKNNKFAVYYRYRNETCENLDFEKMKNLNGFPIDQLYSMHGELTHTGSEQHIRNDAKMYSNVIYTIIRFLNGTDNVLKFDYKTNYERQYFNDLLIGIVPLEAGLIYMVSRTFVNTGMVAMTQHSDHMSQLQKIISVVDIYTNIVVCIALVIVILFFTFVVRMDIISAILNTIRIMCNTGFVKLPCDTSSRFYLATVLIFIVTMQGIYQGNLASLVTSVIPFPNINTWDDLMNSRHTIYINEHYSQFLQYPEFEGRVVLVHGRGDCSQDVLRNSSVACVNFEAILKDQAEELRLHLTEILKPSLGVVRFRPNWHLENRFNDILQRIYEADVVVPFDLRNNQKSLNDFNYDDDVKSNQNFRNIRLNDMIFAFVILGIGLTCASMTFFFEILFYRIRFKRRVTIVSFSTLNFPATIKK